MQFYCKIIDMQRYKEIPSLNRAGDVDLLRAVGIILMIMGHVGFGKQFDIWEGGFYMPLFFIVSGYFLNRDKKTSLYIRKRIRALLLPYFLFGFCYEILWTIAGHNQWEGMLYTNSLLVPLNGALWFLPALFIADIVGFLSFKYLNQKIAFALVAFIGLFGSLNLISLPLSADSALVGCGFLGIGYLLRNYSKRLLQQKLWGACGILLLISVFIFVNGQVNLRTNEYQIIPLFWINATLGTVTIWNICKWVDTHFKSRKYLGLLKEIGSESMIYVCANQFILFFLWKIPVPKTHILIKLSWHCLEVLLIIAICFMANRIIKNTPLKFMLGK